VLLRPEICGTAGAVAATHWLAAQAGMTMLERGGNAFDAATAAGMVLQVVEPHLNGPGGDVPILLHDGGTGAVKVICGQGPMPQSATIEHFRKQDLDRIPGSGLLAACVPGAFGAWMRLLKEFGRLRLADVMEPAIAYASGGYPVLPKAAEMIGTLAPLFRDEWEESGRTYLPGGLVPEAGSRLRNPVLAETFRRILKEAEATTKDRDGQIEGAERAFYEGFVAEAIDRFVTTSEPIDATGRRNRGLLSGQDMASWRASLEEPASLEYRGHTVHKPGPWSQGPVFLQQLRLLEGFDLAGMGVAGPDYVHTVVEAAKLAFADREAWYGDPDFVDVPLDVLLSAEYADERRALIGPDASGTLRPGAARGRSGWVPPLDGAMETQHGPAWMAQLSDGVPAVLRLTEAKGDTCCVTATDREGNMVAATPSGGWLKSSPVVPGLGFPLGTRGQMAWLIEESNNALAPGKRPRTTLSPTLVTRDGRPYLAFGTPGGDQQDQWTLTFFLNHVEFGQAPQAAVEARAFHTDHVPSSFTPRRARPRSLVIEPGSDASVVQELRRRGHCVDVAAPFSLGKVCATGLRADGVILAAASPRGAQAYAVAR
jgi:gamma-glutamyltranspeptidase / glutathione hydrolase